MMKKLNRKFITFLIVLLIIIIAILISVSGFFISTQAPFINGKVIRKIEYKTNLQLDIYLPTKVVYEKAPLIIFFHGGAWIGGMKESINFNRFNGAINTLREKGYAVISPNYTLAKRNKSPFPECIIDAVDALKWTEKNAETYNFDLNNIGLMGESAGAHIAMMTAFAKEENFAMMQNSIKINYVVDTYGPSDLNKLYHSNTADSLNAMIEKLPSRLKSELDINLYLFGFDPEKDTLKAKMFMEKYSPINYLKGTAPPTLIIQGESDRIVPLNQSLILKDKLDSLNIENEIYTLKNVDHAFIGATKEQKQQVQNWIINFITKYYH